ncbi:MAG: DUF3604 domain-containing protein [Deltaproteobacteria bacterium]|nr:DUF3604 domain-containing protein [Deltaproteobacteria bacterium]
MAHPLSSRTSTRILLVAVWSFACGGSGDDVAPQRAEGLRKPQAAIEATADRQSSGTAAVAPPGDSQILFGDLHIHTSYSWDGFLFSLPLVGGEGVHPPADACDFARYCADLDFFALTDHAESMLAENWSASKESIRHCNALAGDASDPDLVAFMGFEWSQAGLTPETHWGHRNVIFPGTDESELPTRPIGAGAKRELHQALGRNMATLRWLQPQGFREYTAFVDYIDALSRREVCEEGVGVHELPLTCEEIAPSPHELYAKLDEWGFETLAIPHGTTWGTYTPAGSSIAKHLDPLHYDRERQGLIEIYSGHGNSEDFRDFRPFEIDADGERSCPEPTADYLPCCWQAGEIMRSRCGDLEASECQARVELARRYAANVDLRPHNVFPDAAPEQWLDCGQCRDCLRPSYGYRPRESVQYAMALSDPQATDADGRPLRFRYGFVGSSDGHSARPGTGYKQIERSMMTDAVGTPGFIIDTFNHWSRRMDDPRMPIAPERGAIGVVGSDNRVASFLYAGGLAAVHSQSRSREAIWQAMKRREVYGTSGPRILLWFDLTNAPSGPVPMGAEVELAENPRFEVRSVGAFQQQPGCPEWSRQGLRPERLQRLCRNECYHPSDERYAISAIEVVRIRPQTRHGEAVAPLIEDPWRRFPCDREQDGCSAVFEDPEYATSGRDALYYVRVLQEPTTALNGAPLSTQFDAEGNAIGTTLCWGDDKDSLAGCPAPVQERAWSSPIFVNQPRRPERTRETSP